VNAPNTLSSHGYSYRHYSADYMVLCTLDLRTEVQRLFLQQQYCMACGIRIQCLKVPLLWHSCTKMC